MHTKYTENTQGLKEIKNLKKQIKQKEKLQNGTSYSSKCVANYHLTELFSNFGDNNMSCPLLPTALYIPGAAK